jgi:hypothetical protein
MAMPVDLNKPARQADFTAVAYEPQRWPKTWGDEAAGRTKFNFESAVTLRGGEYCFAPSRPFLAAL